MNLKAITIGAILLAGAAGSAQAAQLIVNGDFTQLTSGLGQLGYNTNAVGWSVPGGSYNFVMQNGDAGSNGQYGNVALWTQTSAGNGWNGTTLSGNGNFVAMDGDFQTGAVSQTMHGLIPGDSYYITFNTAISQQANFYGDTIQDITVFWGSSFSEQLYSSNFGSSYALTSQGFSGWTQWGGTLTADSTNEVISFLAYGNVQLPPFALLSDVSVTGPVVPEASTWAMMSLGFAALGFAGFRSSRRKPVAIA